MGRKKKKFSVDWEFLEKYKVPKCQVHGYDCKLNSHGGVVLHSHSVGEPKEYYCDEVCVIGECGDKKSAERGHKRS